MELCNTLMIPVLAFIIVIMLLVITHELGHFFAAKLCNVKILKVSFGFGRKLISFKDKHHTEYAISIIPLGGYVKMLDENDTAVPKEQLQFALNRKHPLQKMLIVGLQIAVPPTYHPLF